MVDKLGARTLWTFAITSMALVMVTLDNLVVTTAIPVIRRDLHASLQSLEWTVNAYTLTFAVLLLTGAALGDRFGRRRLFVIGLAIFTAASAFAALAPSIEVLNAARAIASVEAPSKPRSPNSVNAASRTAARRSSAVFRSAVCACTLVSYHSLTTSVKAAATRSRSDSVRREWSGSASARSQAWSAPGNGPWSA